MKQYSFFRGVLKVITELIIWFGPLAIQLLPDAVGNLTFSAVLRMLINYAKVRAQQAGMLE